MNLKSVIASFLYNLVRVGLVDKRGGISSDLYQGSLEHAKPKKTVSVKYFLFDKSLSSQIVKKHGPLFFFESG